MGRLSVDIYGEVYFSSKDVSIEFGIYKIDESLCLGYGTFMRSSNLDSMGFTDVFEDTIDCDVYC